MIECRGEVRNNKNSRSTTVGANLGQVPELQLNDKSIYDSDVCAVLTKVNLTTNMDKFVIALND